MAKDDYRECRDCDGPDLGALFGGKGDGRCSDCHGEGVIYDIGDALASTATFGMSENYHTCPTCHGTCQCQTCGGTGYEYYDFESNDSESDEESAEDSEEFDQQSYSGGTGEHSGSYAGYSVSTPTTSNNSNILSWVVGIGLVVTAFGVMIYKRSSNDESKKNIPQESQQEQVIIQPPQVRDCETSGRGEYSFINKTSSTIFLFLDYGIDHRNIEVGANQTITISDLQLGEYRYMYSYFKSNNLSMLDGRGTLLVEKCNPKTLELNLQFIEWYTLSPDVWKEIDIPPNGNFVMVMPYKNFRIRFSEDDHEHGGNSGVYLPDSVRKIYVLSPYPEDIQVGIQKYTPYTRDGAE